MASKLEGRVAIVTGGASGIGRGIAIEFAREGANIVVADISEEPRMEEQSKTTVEKIQQIGQDAHFIRADVRDPESVQNVMDTTASKFGGIDILVNNAGISGPGSVEDTTLEFWNKVLEINLTGPFLCAKYAIPYLYQSDQGRIINISSQGSVRASGKNTAYCVSKAGVSHLTRSLAAECSPNGVNVNAIMPGPIRTSMMVDTLDDEEARKPVDNAVLTPYTGVPKDIGRVAVFLASDDSRFVTGHNLAAEGGWLVN